MTPICSPRTLAIIIRRIRQDLIPSGRLDLNQAMDVATLCDELERRIKTSFALRDAGIR